MALKEEKSQKQAWTCLKSQNKVQTQVWLHEHQAMLTIDASYFKENRLDSPASQFKQGVSFALSLHKTKESQAEASLS